MGKNIGTKLLIVLMVCSLVLNIVLCVMLFNSNTAGIKNDDPSVKVSDISKPDQSSADYKSNAGEVLTVTIKGGTNEEGDILNDETIEYHEGDTWKDIAENNSRVYINDRNAKRGELVICCPHGSYSVGAVLCDGKPVHLQDTIDQSKNYYLEIY